MINRNELNGNVANKNVLNNEAEIGSNTLNETGNTAPSDTNSEEENDNAKIIKTASPSGFAGSSLHQVRLYSDGRVYLATYSGDGFDDSDVVEKELIATNAEDIEEITYEDYESNNTTLEPGTVIIKGKNLKVIDDGYGWILFKK